MGDVWEIGLLIVFIGVLVVLLAPRLMRRTPGADAARGDLLVTGVSPKPDETGQQFVTITGVINGPTITEHVVYQRMVVDVNDWPRMGDLLPVVYSTKNPDNWSFAPPA